MQPDALGHLHVHGLREDAPAFMSGVATAHTAGDAVEPSRTTILGMVESEKRGERDMALEFLRSHSAIRRN